MASEVVCPFCSLREQVVGEGGRLLFQTEDAVVFHRCPCGAVGFHSPWVCQGAMRGDRQSLEVIRRHVTTDPNAPLQMRWDAITETDPPERLLWVLPEKRRTAHGSAA